MGAIADLIGKIPAAAKYRAALEAMEQENVQLRAENEDLRQELAQYLHQWETLDGDAVTTLVYLSQYARGHSQQIAAMTKVNPQTVEAYLKFLAQHAYVNPPADGEAGFGIAHKGRRYLRERGLLKPPKAKAKSATARARVAPPAKKTRKRR